MAQGFELRTNPLTSYIGLKCYEHGEMVWGPALQILPDGRFDTSTLKCHWIHVEERDALHQQEALWLGAWQAWCTCGHRGSSHHGITYPQRHHSLSGVRGHCTIDQCKCSRMTPV